jgi:hypothetical protein
MDQFEGRIAQMIARGFKPVAWVAAIGSAALGCYMLSLQVAAERSELAGIEHRIVSARQQIRSLQTELGTRGRVQQLEQWNSEVLALSAPVAGQFLESNVSLARFDAPREPAPVERDVRMASAEAPGAAAPVAAPTVRLASAAAVQPPKPVTAAATPRPTLRNASLALVATPAAAPAARPAAAAPHIAHSAPPAGPAPLLDAGTLRELRSTAHSEQGGGTRD